MYSDEELSVMAADRESETVERKETAAKSAKDEICKAICAFSNDLQAHGRAGVVFVGLRDDGTPAGLRIDDELLRDLSAIRSDGNILPLPVLSVQKRTVGGTEVAVLEVAPAQSPPVAYRGRTWIRVGPRKAIASRDEERILVERRQTTDRPFDQRAVADATLDDLDLDWLQRVYLPAAVAPEILAQNERGLDAQLGALHLATGGRPTAAALLVAGRDPGAFVPGAYVQFARFEGTEMTDPIAHQKDMSAPLFGLLPQLDELLAAQIHVATRVAGQSIEQRQPDYPTDALIQLLRNAVMHRNYETSNAPIQWYWFADRVELHNPGGLYGRVTAENFGDVAATDYRNPALAASLKLLGFVQRFGMGIPLARKACQDNGNPPPEFIFDRSRFVAIVRSKP
jgi:ATP-dependent DNA helicase RecG